MRPEYLYYFASDFVLCGLGAAHFACTIVLLIRWAILRSARSRNGALQSDMHKHAPVQYPKSFKVLAYIVIGGYLLVIIPAIVWAVALALHASNPLMPSIIAAVIGFIGFAVLISMPLSHKKSAATVDSRGPATGFRDRVMTPEERKKIEEKIAYTGPINAGGEIDDKAKYRDYLEDVLSKIPFEKRDEIIKLVLQGDKLEAMRVCQRATKEGLRISTDLFSNYLMFPNLKYFNCRIYVRISDSDKIRESFREYNGIYTGPDKCYISAERDLDDNWHYIELSPATSDPEDFSFAEFMNVLIWMGGLTRDVFAYAKPNNTYPGMGRSAADKVGDWTNTEPFYAEPDRNDKLTESCIGIMNGKEFRFVVTELEVSYKKELNSGFDIEAYISKKHRVALS